MLLFCELFIGFDPIETPFHFLPESEVSIEAASSCVLTNNEDVHSLALVAGEKMAKQRGRYAVAAKLRADL